MARCVKCEGRGFKHNPKFHPGIGVEPSLKCRTCRGSGFVIGDVGSVLNFLKHLEFKFEKDKEYLMQVKQCIDVIEKY